MEDMQKRAVIENQPAMTDQSLAYLKTSAGWAQFLSIVSFICCGLVVLAGLTMFILFFVMPSGFYNYGGLMVPNFNIGSALVLCLAVFYLVLGGIGFIVAYYLYKFATDSKRAVMMRNTDLLTSGMAAMSKYFKITGILTIVTLILSFMWIPIMVLIQI